MREGQAVSVTSLPNVLGIGRIVATPVVMALLVIDVPGSDLAGGALFALAGASDFVDGRIARSRDQVTPLGTFMDLVADKVLVAGVLIAMVDVEVVPMWVAATIIVREFVVQSVRQVAAADDLVIPAGRLGKVKTAVTLASLALLFLAADAATGGPVATTGLGPTFDVLGTWLLLAATLVTVVSGVEYLRGAWPTLVGSGRRGDSANRAT